MSTRVDLGARLALAFLVVLGIFAVRWNFDLHFWDWQVWEASVTLFEQGENPYDDAVLNAELRGDPEQYGVHYPKSYMYLLSPPTWLATVRATGSSSLLVNFTGALMLFGTIIAFTRKQEWDHVIAALGGAAYFSFLSPGATSFQFGQPGFFFAGLVGLQFLLFNRRSWGVPIAVIGSKPQFAVALALVGFTRDPRRTIPQVLGPYALLVALSVALFGFRSWTSWVKTGAGSAETHSADDMSIAGLTSALPWRDFGLGGVLVGCLAAAALCWAGRRSDPVPIAFGSLALTTYFSGHAFMHDWLWLALVPAAFRWKPIASLFAPVVVASVLLARRTAPPLPLGYQASVATIITIGLVAIAINSIRTSESPTRLATESDDSKELASSSLGA